MVTPREAGFAPPPLSVWGRVWRLLAAIAVGGLSWIATAESLPAGEEGFVVLDLVLGIAAMVLMTQRRRRPVLVAVLTVALTTFSAAAVGAAGVAVISLATRRRWSEVLGVAGLWLVGSVVSAEYYPPAATDAGAGPWWLGLLMAVLSIAILIVIGFYIGARRELVASLRARAETAEREQSARADQARVTERARIAREMHDVLAHRISLVAMHSGALVYRTDLTAQETTQTATVIRDNAHLALTELREVLGVLRSPGTPPLTPDRPQPSLASLPELIEEARAAGESVELRTDGLSGDLHGVPETTGRTTYRVVQEALTNARKHAPGAPVHVTITARSDRLVIEVRNPSATGRHEPLPRSGMGLAGLLERVTLAGGGLSHTVDRAGDFVLRAWVPWPT